MRRILKEIGLSMALIAAVPFYLSFLVKKCLFGEELAFEGSSSLLSLLPGISGRYLRGAFYRLTLDDCSRHSAICFGVTFATRHVKIGKHAYIGNDCNISYSVIENDVLLGTGVHIVAGKHTHYISDVTKPIRMQGGELRVVRVGEGSWIGNQAVIMADVGRHAVVGAGAVVTRPVPDYAIVAGNPAVLIRCRLQECQAGECH